MLVDVQGSRRGLGGASKTEMVKLDDASACPVPPSRPGQQTPSPLTSSSSPFITVGSTRVYGLPVDQQTRCVHWHGPVDVVALSHPCCERFYPCADCHDAVTEHTRRTWPRAEQRPTVLCGACGHLMKAKEYIGAEGCPACKHPFNPRCALHRERYFGPA